MLRKEWVREERTWAAVRGGATGLREKLALPYISLKNFLTYFSLSFVTSSSPGAEIHATLYKNLCVLSQTRLL